MGSFGVFFTQASELKKGKCVFSQVIKFKQVLIDVSRISHPAPHPASESASTPVVWLLSCTTEKGNPDWQRLI